MLRLLQRPAYLADAPATRRGMFTRTMGAPLYLIRRTVSVKGGGPLGGAVPVSGFSWAGQTYTRASAPGTLALLGQGQALDRELGAALDLITAFENGAGE